MFQDSMIQPQHQNNWFMEQLHIKFLRLMAQWHATLIVPLYLGSKLDSIDLYEESLKLAVGIVYLP